MHLHVYGTEGNPDRGGIGGLLKILVPALALVPVALGLWVFFSGPGGSAPAAAPASDATARGSRGAAATGATFPSLQAIPNDEVEADPEAEVPLTARARGERGVPMVDTLVVWSVESGMGTLSTDSVRTDGQGISTSTLTLPPGIGTTVVAARVAGASMPPARFRVSATPGPPARVAVAGGDGQSGRPNALLSRRIAVRVADAQGNPVPGVEVRFEVLTGEGGVAPSRTRTDTLGVASSRWRLGPATGSQTLAALVPGVEDGVRTLRATAVAPQPALPSSSSPSSGAGSSAGAASPSPSSPERRALDAPVNVTRRTFAIGGSGVCGLADGTAGCRGSDDRGQRAAGETAPELAAVAPGVSHACGLEPSGAAWCWGANEAGQLGDGSRTDRDDAVAVSTELRFSTLAAGLSHTCGLTGGGIPACWGRNVSGQVGDGSRADRLVPQPADTEVALRSLVAGWNHTCGLGGGGEAYCWGLNADGQLGDGSRLDRLRPTAGPGSFSRLTAGSGHTCGIREGEVYCWGANDFGQLGDGSTTPRTRPVPVQGLPGPAAAVAAGAVHTCALLGDGTAYCWGQNLHGQLGDGTTESRRTATPVWGDQTFARLHAGGAVTCAFTAEGTQHCWGLNQSGQLGDGTRANRRVPTRVGG
jgi:alpha-tubulin suppressor-like RCC1 family protein